MRDRCSRRPSPRALVVNLGQAWAWILLWSFLAFLPTAFGALGQGAFFLALGCTVGLGLCLSANGWLNRRRPRDRSHPTPPAAPPPPPPGHAG